MRQVTGYIPSWDPSIFSKLDAMLCTTFIISFASVDPNGRVTPPENIKELSGVLKTASSKVTLSVGGGNAGPAVFKTVAADPNLREVFAKSCLEICKQYNLDGIDIDWEFPDSSDRENFVALHRVLKQALGGRTVTSALAASNWFVNNQKIYDIGALSRHVDAVHLLTYDFHMDANWDVQSGVNFNAPLSADGGDSLENGIKMFLDGGMPAAKILVGVPFFSRVYKLQDPSKHDPGAPFVVGNQASDPNNYVLSYAKVRLNDASHAFFETLQDVPIKFGLITHFADSATFK